MTLIKDKIFHIILITIIFILLGAAVYFKLTQKKDPTPEEFLSKTDKLSVEQELQQIPEKVSPNAIKVPILIYHSIKPHNPGQSSSKVL